MCCHLANIFHVPLAVPVATVVVVILVVVAVVAVAVASFVPNICCALFNSPAAAQNCYPVFSCK